MRRMFFATVIAVFCIFGFSLEEAKASPPAGRIPGQVQGGSAVSGTVSYRERTKLPGKAMVNVELLDVTGKDPRIATIGKQSVWPAWAPLPVDFRIEYDPSRIDPTHSYIVRARIMDGEELLFISIIPYYVLTKGAPSKVDIIVVPAQVRVR